MKIYNNGIYFKQTDRKEVGYYIKDSQGALIHQEYEKPTLWQRAKYFARYGYELSLETRLTSYLYFFPKDNMLSMESIVGDAVSTAKYLRKSRNFHSWHKYVLEGNTIYFDTSNVKCQLDFQDDGLKCKLHITRKFDNVSFTETYTFLDWNNI